MRKTVMAMIAVSMLLALPVVAGAAPVFPGITSTNLIRPNGPHVTFINMSGVVGNLNLSFTTFTGLSPKTTTKVRNFNAARHDRGVELQDVSFLKPDQSGRFVQLQDVIIFGDDASLGMRAQLVAPRGNRAFGPAAFELLLPPEIRDGDQIRIQGAAEVTIIVTNPKLGRGVMLVSNMQPGEIRKRTFRNGTALGDGRFHRIPADARMSMSAANKKFFLQTSIAPPFLNVSAFEEL